MKKIILALLFLLFPLMMFGQKEYTSRKGSKFFPTHLDIVITESNDSLRYEIFNHWYSHSYAKLRDVKISIKEIDIFNSKNDSIKFKIKKNKIHLTDKKYRLNRNVKKKRLCASADYMRKISYAYEISQKYKIRHFSIYDSNDLKLSEKEFRKKAEENLLQKINSEKTE